MCSEPPAAGGGGHKNGKTRFQQVIFFIIFNKMSTVKTVSQVRVSYLVCEHKDRLHGETPRAEVEQVLKAGSQQVHD